MKKLYLLYIMAFLFASCEKFLDTNDYLNKDDNNFPADERDVNQILAASYYNIAVIQENSSYFVSDVISDDNFAGAGPNDFHFHAWDQLKKSNENMFNGTWSSLYQGIYGINKFFENVGITKFSSEETKNNYLGEAYFLRAYYYFELAKMFGEVPLLTTSEKINKPRTQIDSVYALIASDLKKAITMMDAIPYQAVPKTKLGHATKWAAEALLARVYLFYTGYYNKNDIALSNNERLNKNEVISYLEDCIKNSGHKLLPEFRNNWPYTNKLTGSDYLYNKGKNLEWVGDNDNYETVFAIKFGTTGSWSNMAHANMVCLNHSLRGQSSYANVFPFAQGWGMGTVNPVFFKEWQTNERYDTIRRTGSVLNIDDPNEGIVNYEDGGWQQMHDSHLWQKKYTGINAWVDKANKQFKGYSTIMFGGLDDYAFISTQDQVLIRFSDVLLMHAELTETPEGINIVRQRVKLPPVGAYSIETLRNERRYELAFEGLRYFDLLRWYGKDAGAIIDKNQNGADVLNNLIRSKINYNLTERVQSTGGFLPIPQNQIDLSGNVLVQTPGWVGGTSQL